MTTTSPLKVAVYAQFAPKTAGGIAEALLQLVTHLGGLDGPETYVVVTSPEAADWLRPHLGPNEILAIASEYLSHAGPVWERKVAALMRRRAKGLLPLAERAWRMASALPNRSRASSRLPASDGYIEGLDANVVHFPYQRYVRTALPSIYEPWDLQHRHLPQFFAASERRARDNLYRSACNAATSVVVATDWVRNDLVEQYLVPRSKILKVRRGIARTARSAKMPEHQLDIFRQRTRIPMEYMLYPAHSWPHKNHVRLLEAMARLRDVSGVRVNLVCTGATDGFFRTINARMRSLHLENQVTFLGYVSPDELQLLYRFARFLVFPSLFEGYGFPLIEALQAGVPIACSNVTSVPETVGDAALLFDPWSTEAIAQAVLELWQQSSRRAALVERGRARLQLFDATLTAKTFRALYRWLGGAVRTDEDEHLLRLAR